MFIIGFGSGNYAKVWQTDVKSETMTNLRISISKKNKKTDEYEQEFNGFVTCVGKDCAKKAAKLKEGDRIKLGNVDVTNKYDKVKNVTYTNFKVFDFEMADGTGTQTSAAKPAAKAAAKADVENDEEGELPF